MKMHKWILLITVMFCGWSAAGEVRFDFETGDLQGWRVVKGSFGRIVSDRDTEFHSNTPYTKVGRFFLTTLERADGSRPDDSFTGVIESPVVVLDGPEITLRVGGGRGADVYVALCDAEGREIARAHGENRQQMIERRWDVPDLVGKPVFFRVVDRSTGGWGHITLDHLVCRGSIDLAATEQRFKARNRIIARAPIVDPLRRAIRDLSGQFATRYPADEFIRRLDDAEEALDAEAVKALAIEALLRRNPLVNAQPIVFVVRAQYPIDHHNSETMFQTGEVNTGKFGQIAQRGSALKVLDPVTGRVTTLLEAPRGIIRDPDVHFDGDRILFSMRREIGEDYKIFEIRADGTGLRQLTIAAGVSDIGPIWMPDDAIVFTSTREPKYCMCNRHIMGNLFRMESDGANIHQISRNTLHDGNAALMPDGRILYDRWEYVDRNFGDAQGLWTSNPDGTDHAIYWGNNTPSPGGVVKGRILPDGNRVLCILGSCHDRPWGALAIIDRRLGLDGRAPVLRTWPESAITLVRNPGEVNGWWDAFMRVRPRYEDPYPLSDTQFLVVRTVAETGNNEQTGIFLVDVFGNELLLHTEEPGCFAPRLLAPRTRPPVIPARRNFENGDGRIFVQDVYRGPYMRNVKRGAVKYLRVVESPPKISFTPSAWAGQGVQHPAMNWHSFESKRILGTVPVESDGSAYVSIPADRFVYFQLLDEDGMMIQSMRSGTMVQSGETTGCIGCHEDRRVAPLVSQRRPPLALQRPPSRLAGWQGPQRDFCFRTEVQPVFDRHCVSCHDFGKPAGDKLLLSGDRSFVFNIAYEELHRKRMVSAIGGGPAQTLPAYHWGARQSKVIQTLLEGHNEVKLSPAEMDRIVTWIDINAPYYPTYLSSSPDGVAGRTPATGSELNRFGTLTGIALRFGHNASEMGSVLSLDRPALSPALARLSKADAPAFQEAVGILETIAQRMEQRPRADMPGFVPSEACKAREDRYRERARIEDINRQAIREGRRHYGDGVERSGETAQPLITGGNASGH